MKSRNAGLCRIAGIALGVLVAGSAWSQAGDENNDKSGKIMTQIQGIMAEMGLKAQSLESVTLPQPAAGVTARVMPADVDYPWSAAIAETVFEKARANALDWKRLAGRWQLVAQADNNGGTYSLKSKSDAYLIFADEPSPFNDNRRIRVVNYRPYSLGAGSARLEIRSPSAFFFGTRTYDLGHGCVSVDIREVECRLIDEDHLICKRTETSRFNSDLEGTSFERKPTVTIDWLGFARARK